MALAAALAALGGGALAWRRTAAGAALRKAIPGMGPRPEAAPTSDESPVEVVAEGPETAAVQAPGQETPASHAAEPPGQETPAEETAEVPDQQTPAEETAEPAAQTPAERSAKADEGGSHRQEWHCECGQGYLVAGQDRHQIYWLEDAEENDPVLSDHCPSCDRPLPAISRANAGD